MSHRIEGRYWRERKSIRHLQGRICNYYSTGDQGPQRGTFDDFRELVAAHEGTKLVFKTSFGSGSQGVLVAEVRQSSLFLDGKLYGCDEFADMIADPQITWVIQRYLNQHPSMAQLNESSVNTMRLVTFNTGLRVVVAPQVMVRIGKPGSMVDNRCFYAGVNEVGTIGESVFSFFEMTRSKAHCAGLAIPFFEEARELVREAHQLIPGLFTLGWDIAISPDGPVVIEANDGWEPFLSQTELGHGMRPLWDEMEQERIGFLGYDPNAV